MLVKNGLVWTMEQGVIENGFVEIENGVIKAVGEGAPEGAECFDAAGGWILPGLVDCHTHLGLFEDSLGFEGEDGNEDTDPVTPHLRVLDAVNPMERCFEEALAAGVTTAVVSPGSANAIGGQIAAFKTCGKRIDKMIVKAPLAIKFALGENPKAVYHDKNQAPVTRMATAALIREALRKAKDYQQRLDMAENDEDLPEFDSKSESLLPLLRREIPAHFHAHRADDIFTALRIAREFEFELVIIHGTEAHLVTDELSGEQAPVVTGPLLTDRSKPELRHLTTQSPAILHKAGILTAICTDHPEIPLKYLMDSAAAAVRGGMEEKDALAAVTRNAAEIAGIADKVGSLRPGKDGDLVIYTGDPFMLKTKVAAVFVNGKRVK